MKNLKTFRKIYTYLGILIFSCIVSGLLGRYSIQFGEKSCTSNDWEFQEAIQGAYLCWFGLYALVNRNDEALCKSQIDQLSIMMFRSSQKAAEFIQITPEKANLNDINALLRCMALQNKLLKREATSNEKYFSNISDAVINWCGINEQWRPTIIKNAHKFEAPKHLINALERK